MGRRIKVYEDALCRGKDHPVLSTDNVFKSERRILDEADAGEDRICVIKLCGMHVVDLRLHHHKAVLGNKGLTVDRDSQIPEVLNASSLEPVEIDRIVHNALPVHIVGADTTVELMVEDAVSLDLVRAVLYGGFVAL